MKYEDQAALDAVLVIMSVVGLAVFGLIICMLYSAQKHAYLCYRELQRMNAHFELERMHRAQLPVASPKAAAKATADQPVLLPDDELNATARVQKRSAPR